MGTWGSGLMDGDGPLDYIGDLAHQIEADVTRWAKETSSEATAARLGAAIGLLLQISAYSFESDFSETLKKALDRHSKTISILPSEARAILEHIARGNGRELSKGSGPANEALASILGKRWGDQTRHSALFQHPEAVAYVQSFADNCANIVDQGFEGENLDLYQVDFMGVFGVFLVIAPIRLDRRRVEEWRENLRQVHEETKVALSKPINQSSRTDLPFFEEYMANAEKAFDLLLAKST